MAPSRPAAIALITNFGPVTTSPPANISLCAVWPVSSAVCTVPFRLNNMFSGAIPPRSTFCPIAAITLFALISLNSPVPIGLRRPFASRSSLNSIISTFKELTFPSFANISLGAVRNTNLTPSSCASATSRSSAGISSRVRR